MGKNTSLLFSITNFTKCTHSVITGHKMKFSGCARYFLRHERLPSSLNSRRPAVLHSISTSTSSYFSHQKLGGNHLLKILLYIRFSKLTSRFSAFDLTFFKPSEFSHTIWALLCTQVTVKIFSIMSPPSWKPWHEKNPKYLLLHSASLEGSLCNVGIEWYVNVFYWLNTNLMIYYT